MCGTYRYTADLQALTSKVASRDIYPWTRYHTPINLERLRPFLLSHPDHTFVALMLDGLHNGFHVGFNHQGQQLKSRGRNHPSACTNPAIVDEHVATELKAGRLLGPLTPRVAQLVHTSPVGLVPKSRQPGKFRLIVDLSSPEHSSVNDGISEDLCSIKYASVDDAVAIIQSLGRNTELAKLDLKDAYRIVPVHPQDYHLLGISWKGKTYIDRALPFGLRSAPKLFSAVSDLIAWVLHQHGITYQLHYLDDFLFLGPPLTAVTEQALTSATRVLHELGIPVALHKLEGPAKLLEFLGVLIDTHSFQLRLPAAKLGHLQTLCKEWAAKSCCRRRDLESFLGHLCHAATVVRQGRTFLRELFSLLTQARKAHFFIRLNARARADILWWRIFLQHWNGSSFFPTSTPSITITSDASGSFGCGAFCSAHGWFQIQWPQTWQSAHITVKELVPVVVAAALWGPHWRGKHVLFRVDNMAVVGILQKRTSPDPHVMHLLRCFILYTAVYHFTYIMEHIAGNVNTAADAISRNNIPLFCSLIPQVQQIPVPQAITKLLINQKPDWGSPTWTALFTASLTGEFRTPPEQSTRQAGAGTSHSAHNST